MRPTLTPDREEFEKVFAELAEGQQLTFTKMARVFGFATYELILHALLSAEEASYVIRDAMAAATADEPKEADGHSS